MRYTGPFQAASVPSFAALAAASTAGRVAALAALDPRVTVAANAHAAATPNVHQLTPINLTRAEKAVLEDGYDGRSAAVKRLLEAMRQSLGPVHLDLCPYCSLESTAALDHYLPKKKFAEFSLYGPNLLPICDRCNRHKLTVVANAAGQRMVIMPTADAAVASRVLTADLAILPEPHFTFRIDNATAVQGPDLSLIQRHFGRLKLADRYRRRAHSLVAALKENLLKQNATPQIANRAINDGRSAAHNEGPVNGWKIALYDAIHDQQPAFVHWLTT